VLGVEEDIQEVGSPNQRYGENGGLWRVFGCKDKGALRGGDYGIAVAENQGKERLVKGVLDVHCGEANKIGSEDRQSKNRMCSKECKSSVDE
jgi:hypothetical protein